VSSVTSTYTSPGQIVFDAGHKIHQIIDEEIPYYCPTLVLRCKSNFFKEKHRSYFWPSVHLGSGPGGGMGRLCESERFWRICAILCSATINNYPPTIFHCSLNSDSMYIQNKWQNGTDYCDIQHESFKHIDSYHKS